MPFIDINGLQVIERLPWWKERYFHSTSMTFAHYDFIAGSSIHELDDLRRYVERAVMAGVDAKLDVWMGMPHGFVTDIGRLNAATQALNTIGAFLIERLERTGR